MKMRGKPSIIIVSGLPRSGTSLMMQMLENGGLEVFTDSQREADSSNPKGYYEHEAVKRIFRDKSWLPEAKNKVVKVVAPLVFHLPASMNYKIIFMVRDLEEILESQQRMLAKNNKTDSGGKEELLRSAFRKTLDRVDPWVEQNKIVSLMYVRYTDLVYDTENAVGKIVNFLNIPLDTSAMASAVDPALYRVRKGSARTGTIHRS